MDDVGLGADRRPATESPMIEAAYVTRCTECDDSIMRGDTIGGTGDGWAHARCLR